MQWLKVLFGAPIYLFVNLTESHMEQCFPFITYVPLQFYN